MPFFDPSALLDLDPETVVDCLNSLISLLSFLKRKKTPAKELPQATPTVIVVVVEKSKD